MHVILDRDEGIYAESVLVDLFCPLEKRFSPSFSPPYSFITFLRISVFWSLPFFFNDCLLNKFGKHFVGRPVQGPSILNSSTAESSTTWLYAIQQVWPTAGGAYMGSLFLSYHRPSKTLCQRPPILCCPLLSSSPPPQWGAADAEIKVPSGENTELKRSPFQAWSRSVFSHTCYAYCQGVRPRLFLPFQSIHLHFFQNLSQFFPVLACRIK